MLTQSLKAARGCGETSGLTALASQIADYALVNQSGAGSPAALRSAIPAPSQNSPELAESFAAALTALGT